MGEIKPEKLSVCSKQHLKKCLFYEVKLVFCSMVLSLSLDGNKNFA
jgi:hypothetical protein